ncbi:MAG: signal peptide peptidase SppA [Alphaproteobacteria bacterium]|nr:signal peptide peptidase SppA [Alphaproteobacteria bacterium]
MVLGAFMLLSIMTGVMIANMAAKSGGVPKLPDEMVLFLDLDQGLTERPQAKGFADQFGPSEPSVRDIVNMIDTATRDERVHGILARVEGGQFGMSHVYEVRAALKRFREAGKFTYIYSTSYGDAGGGLSLYYLASAFEQIWVQPMGIVAITGMSAEMPFFRKVLDKIGVQPQFFKRKDYKTAYENLTNEEMSAENREMMTRLVGDIREEILKEIPADRGMGPAQFERLVHKGLFPAPEALKAGLVTRVDYGDVLLGTIREKMGYDRDSNEIGFFVNIPHYMAGLKHEKTEPGEAGHKARKPSVALVYAAGMIMPSGGRNAAAPVFMNSEVAAADEIGPAITEAAEDKNIKAIVLRIDSPGGSPVASETILHAVERAQNKGKKVIVSMGPVAASGGYWIAAYADRIFVTPTTLTGSIGVLGGKFATQDLSEKLGVSWDGVSWGENAGMWSVNTPFSESEAARINVMLDQVYDGFLERVSKGRKMSIESVDKIAGGRVWTGKRAVEIGLADEIGGLENALDYVAQSLGQADRHALNVVIMPEPKTAIEKFLELLEQQGEIGQAVQWQMSIVERLAPALEMMAVTGNRELYATYEPLRLE